MYVPTRKARSHELTDVAAQMRSFILSIAAAMSITTAVAADYQGLQVQLHTQVNLSGQDYSVYRVYTLFSDPNDYHRAIVGSPTLGNMRIQSRNAGDTGSGSVFFNPTGGSIFAPTLAAIATYPSVEFDTFGTIGVSIADQAPPPGDQTGVSAGFLGIGSVTQIDTNRAAWFITGDAEQGRAGFLGDGDPLLRVLCLQLTVNSGDNVRGTFSVQFNANGPLAGDFAFAVGQTFNSFPAPGGLALVMLAGAWPRRRRGLAR